MNSLFVLLGIESWKPVLNALVLPPVPWLVLILLGAWRLKRNGRWGGTLVFFGAVLLWLSSCAGCAIWLQRLLLDSPAPLSASRLDEIRARAKASSDVAIVILGGGSEPLAPEYGASNLTAPSAERLRYGVWLARATGAPMAFSGGVGWAQQGTQNEAEIAARVAQLEYGMPLRWTETDSRDTRENAARSVAMLGRDDVKHLLIVTHDWHMQRSLRAFKKAAADRLSIEAAPMALGASLQPASLAWLPSTEGHTLMRRVVHEAFGLLMGA